MPLKQVTLKQWFTVILLCVALPLISLLTIAQVSGHTPRGTVPRSAATDYAAHASPENLQIGATLLTHKDLKKVLASDVNQCCLVVEVAFFPAKDNFVKISLDDFMLRETGMELGARPSTADVLAARLEVIPTKPDREHTPGISTTSDVGYERTTGNNPNNPQDPGQQQTNRGGIYQREGVGVGVPIGGRSPNTNAGAAAAGNRQAIEAELRERGLPEVSSWDPVSGYLYFSVPKKKKDGYELVYMMGDKKIVLPLK